ncbi:MAG: hypothetical protein AB8B73_01485 [Ekhidna sp.]
MYKKVKVSTALMLLIATLSFGQTNSVDKEDGIKYKHTIGSSLFMLGNLLEDSPDYYLLTYGYRLNKRDRIFAEFNTWKYAEPLGTYGKSEEFYPGFVRAWGLGVGYQCFMWKGLFATVQGTSFMKQYHDSNNEKTQKGFQLYLQAALGYRVEFLKKRFYVEPAIALKYWPIDTNTPEEIAKINEGTPIHIFEPSMNFGFKF